MLLSAFIARMNACSGMRVRQGSELFLRLSPVPVHAECCWRCCRQMHETSGRR